MTSGKQLNISPNPLNELTRRILLYSLLFLFAGSNLPAQNPFVSHMTTSEGLPSNTVYKIFQDRNKYIWFATNAGVARYDGTNYTYFRKQDGLSSNDVYNIEEDSFGRIWFFHVNSSLNYFYNNTIFNEKNTAFLDSLKSTYFSKSIVEDEQHNIYFYQNPQYTIYQLDPQNQVTKFKLRALQTPWNNDKINIEAKDVHYLEKLPNGGFNLWAPYRKFSTSKLSELPVQTDSLHGILDLIVSSNKLKYAITRSRDGKVYEARRYTGENFLIDSKTLPSSGSHFITSILEDTDSVLWISTYDKGVYCFRGNNLIHHFDIKEAESVIQDHENNIWISSQIEGVYKICPNFSRYRHFEKSAFGNNSIYAMCKNDSGGIWCTNGKEVYRLKDYELTSLAFQQAENSFNQILQVDHQTLLVGETSKLPFSLQGIRRSSSGKTFTFTKVSQSTRNLKKIIYNKTKNELSSFNQNLVYSIPPDKLFGEMKPTQIGERIYNIFYNSNNDLVINARKFYLFQNGQEVPYPELDHFNYKIVKGHLNLDESTELFNIEGDSLFLLHNHHIFTLSNSFEQPIDFQIEHTVCHDSTLFIATSKNIYVCEHPLNVLKKEPVILHEVNIDFNSIYALECDGDQLYIASGDGLTAVSCKELIDNHLYPPIPYFRNIQVNDQKNEANLDRIDLKSSQKINISFSCINYSINPVIYSYQLEGADRNWTFVKDNSVVLQNLPKGSYKFRLRVKKSSSQWSDPISFGINVHATIWQQPYFYILVILLFAGLIFNLTLRRKNLELERHEMEHQMLLLEQKSLQAMMNPHFIFNSLGSIQNYLLHNKPNEAGIYLSQFARLIRQNLNAIDNSMTNLEEEVDRLKNYLELEKLRLEDKFEYFIVIEEDIEADLLSIPSMIIQPFVENSVWHGIANLSGKGMIRISFLLLNETSLQIVVEDSGIGLNNAANYDSQSNTHLKIGLNITTKRLSLLQQKYGTATSIQYSETSPGAPDPGTKVTIVVPARYGKYT